MLQIELLVFANTSIYIHTYVDSYVWMNILSVHVFGIYFLTRAQTEHIVDFRTVGIRMNVHLHT